MSNVVNASDGLGYLTVSSEILKKYSHYQYLRVSSITSNGHSIKAILQGFNGKKWVRVKSKPTRASHE